MNINGIRPDKGLNTAIAAQTKNGQAFTEQLEKALNNSKATDNSQDEKLRKACKDMEAVFINIMLTQMRNTVPKSSLFDNSNQQEIFQSMLDKELSTTMSKAGGIGLAGMIYRQLSVSSAADTSKVSK